MKVKNNVTDDMGSVRLRDDGKAVVIIDQSLLPGRSVYLDIETLDKMYEAILHLRVRGAPAIGIFAAYCIAVMANRYSDNEMTADSFIRKLKNNGEYLKSSRPTAVNLAWAVDRVIKAGEDVLSFDNEAGSVDRIIREINREAEAIHKEDIKKCMEISKYGLSLVKDGDGILTHCNAGPLATSRYGTALGPIILGKEKGMEFKVFADETRPLLQGARLTSYELSKAGVDVTLICDNMASAVMKNGWIQACFVGCDRIAANGDTANKIGTSAVAILASYYDIPFYVLGPTSTIDHNCMTGDDIPIELRSPDEIKTKFYCQQIAPEEVKCYNPAFDVTDHSLITAIVTEKGICRPPFDENLKAL